ncbi:uncharacterized protein F4807DRAFT_429124 [Annulohypoxylon truncatum]|uniref:uncharacterized protein n=1 Tax=Annulohypoxylon truncatum TaxID=327061 RepID=UPI002008DE62|nr:uncharacterized protein F4807DRAFT_429124 [Annulohypoxylon truncatum]KAI1208729.1 hypothetical protein F4807DRAFT_429124 [Annulohypoxylon truncatum]
MSDEIRQTPVPVPFVYGQPAASQSADTTMSNPNEPLATVAEDPSSGMAAAPAPSTEAAASPSNPASGSAPQTTTTTAAPTTTTTGGSGNTPTPTNAPSPAAATAPGGSGRTGTPLRNTNGGGGQENAAATSTSRAASQHPDAGFAMPAEAPAHGAPARQYLNSKVTGPLLDGMKKLVQEKPKDPLRVLGEYLIQRSKELETTST